MTADKTEGLTTLVTPGLEERRGVWVDGQTSFPVSESDIRKWAISSYWPDEPPPLFWDEEYAKSTRWGGIIAPQDFNPFAWPVKRPKAQAGPAREGPGGVPLTGMNGGQVDTYGLPQRPGDIITSRSQIKGWSEDQTRLGLTLFIETEIEWRNQDDDIVRRRISTAIRYVGT